MTPAADALILFGASGDLAHRKIFPALQALEGRGALHGPVVGVAVTPWTEEQFRERVRQSLVEHGELNPEVFARLSQRLRYVAGDYRDLSTFERICGAMPDARRPLHYLAIPPSLFAVVSDGLARAGCTFDASVVIEKPFGRDLASARALSKTIHATFPEERVFRIDHYLGKEPVQSVTYFRFANPFIEAGWDREHIESVQITMAEPFGMNGRGSLYDELGAIRDVVQNHMLAVIACLAAEQPAAHGPEPLRDERYRLYQTMRTLTSADVVRGQYRGYRDEPGVKPGSTVETFAAVRFHIDNERWSGVPFYVRAGKRMPVSLTEVMVCYRRPPRPVLDENEPPLPNYYRFRLGPNVVVALGTKVKKPGEKYIGERIELVASHESPSQMSAYDRLLGDAIRGDPELFARQDSVEECWRIVDPILEDAAPLHVYEPGTWGPAEADAMIVSEVGWHEPNIREPIGRQSAAPRGST